MRCRCGTEIDNVPEHLRDLATWLCQKCTNTVPKAASTIEQSDEPIRKQVADKRQKEAA